MKKKEITIIAIALVVILTGFGVYDYVFNAEHRNIAEEKATVNLSATELFKQFQANEVEATTNYLDKVIEVNGKITAIENNTIVLNDGVHISFINPEVSKFSDRKQIIIKGRCVGYDELLELVKIDQSTLIK